ncbi:DUF418 domain-containing protein [Actinoplanes derwentensis]|uniref:Uncharacterized membrane protein YeiB n=1 Tax=Actinoplanes derwentensis TaxID=113562 RepID=A0A1H2A1F1_9ACTN|nr:DUF418 domain-containing protein [Actinoplanes derwentensis]GID83428.1 hypothetical protein Ade03nite_23520 [Actinoplanes derwentensis]SDT39750.1 Uncharacterized membrane protein YeiB [Actinoplanes derwentensis]
MTELLRARIVALDVLRGFALCGILFANVKPISHRGGVLGGDQAPATAAGTVLHLLVDNRFFPIFALLFGVGFALLSRSAGSTPVLMRRLLTLLVFGLVHLLLLWRGDVLTAYAIVGLVVLLPSGRLPRNVVAIAAGVLIVASVTLFGGYYSLFPGLFLLGSALVRYEIVDRLATGQLTRTAAVVGLIFAVAAVPFIVMQLGPGSEFIVYPVAGLLTAGAYVCGMVALLGTRAAGVLTMVFRPLGRMTLTNYLTATMLVLVISGVAGDSEYWGAGTVVLVATSVLVTQWIWSVWWLRRFRQGPAEWLWRWATRWQRPALRRTMVR